MSTCRSRAWRNGTVVAEDFALADLDHWLAQPDTLVWLDLVKPEPEVLAALAEELKFDRQAVEDAVAPYERPKATRHRSHVFVTCYSTRLSELPDQSVVLEVGRISAFVMRDALVTVRLDDRVDIDGILARWQDDGLLGHGVAALVHGMLDELVDGHFDTIERMDDVLEGLEDLLFDPKIQTRVIQQRVFGLRKALVRLRRVVLPMREVVTAIMRFHSERERTLSSELEGSFNDLYDHVIRAAEWTESLRDMVSSVFETNLSLQDARLNEVMKKLASWAAIIAVPTAVTGWFGQNVPYPGYMAPYGL
ncbi:magnesium transporter CorA family protein, partial [Propionicimonas sp.]|uniref:magnesium transporter CorA family protein n=1 Tax=Propionicimonas sp. TaxID=1955623 RepID=UPI0039E476CF